MRDQNTGRQQSRPIDPQRAVDFMLENSRKYAQAKANRVHIEQFRKSKKALLMIEAERDHGHKSAAMQERYAYAHGEYIALLDGLHAAVEIEERLRFQLMAAESAIRIWQTRMASDRIERQVIR